MAGIGLHSGNPVRLSVSPAPAGAGITFKRSDLAGIPAVPALFDRVVDTRLCTRIGDEATTISTIEHLMAAFAGCGIHNADVVIDGPEVPILDGSAAPFVREILKAGIVAQDAPIKIAEIKKQVRLEYGLAWAQLSPAPAVTMAFEINFEDQAIGEQTYSTNLANGTFLRELSDCRTFCRASDIDALRSAGLALGGTYDNAVVVDGDEVLSRGGFRRRDECVRHKMLDALGDLALAGAPFLGHFCSHRGGHALTNALLRKAFDTPGAILFRDAAPEEAALLPGMMIEAEARAYA